jgi:hypothetical protein
MIPVECHTLISDNIGTNSNINKLHKCHNVNEIKSVVLAVIEKLNLKKNITSKDKVSINISTLVNDVINTNNENRPNLGLATNITDLQLEK